MRYLILLALLLLTSCEHPSTPKQTLRLNLAEDPVSLDPRVVRMLRDLTVVKQLFDGLTRLDEKGTPQPALAERIDLSDDQLTYTFYLREAFWTNGDPVTAHDFKYAWMSVLDPSFVSDYSYMLYPIKNGKLARIGECSTEEIGVTALDDRTLVVQLETPTPYFLELTAFPTFFPVNQKGEAFNGPFQLKKWTLQSEIQLERNPTYWDQKSVRLQALSFTIIGDNNTEGQLFEKNQLDWLGQPTSHNISTEQLAHLSHDSYPVAGTYWLKFNTQTPPFDQPKVRKAFCYALNRNELITHILQGNQAIATGPLPPSMQLQQGSYFEDGNISEAQKLFEEYLIEEGLTRETFPKIVLNYPPSERNTKIMQLIQQQWEKALNIAVQLESVELHVYRGKIREGSYQVGSGEWIADFNDPLAFLELFKESGMNDTGWSDEIFNQLLDLSLTEQDPVRRRELLHSAEKILVNAMPIAPLYHYSYDYVKKDYVKDVILSPLGIADFKWAMIED